MNARNRTGVLKFTDGLVASANGGGEQFGAARLKGKLSELAGAPPARLCEGLIEEAAAFRGRRAAADDITAVAVKIA